jgi:hypothetical protein
VHIAAASTNLLRVNQYAWWSAPVSAAGVGMVALGIRARADLSLDHLFHLIGS